MQASFLIRLIDQVTAPAQKIQNGLERLRSRARQVGNDVGQGFKANYTVEGFEKAKEQLQEKYNKARSDLMGAAAMAFTLAVPVRIAAQFDQSFKGLEKVLDVPQKRLDELRQFTLDTSKQIPLAARDLLELMSEAAQAGVPQEELEKFSVYVANAAVAFDMAGAEIGERFAKLRNVYKLSQTGIEGLGDAFNHLSNNMAAKASEISEFTNRAAGAAAVLKLNATQMAAIGTAMISAGIVPETAARGFNALSVRIMNGGKRINAAFAQIGLDRQKVYEGFQKDAPKAMMELFKVLSEHPDGLSALADIAGQDFSDDFAKFVSNPALLKQAFDLVEDGAKYSGSALEEARKQGSGAVRQYDLLINKTRALGIGLGTILLPPLLSLADHVGQATDAISGFAATNPTLASGLVYAAAGIMGLSIAARLARFAFFGVRLAILPLLRSFLLFKDGKNIAVGWRMLAGSARLLSGAFRGIAGSAGLAGRAVGAVGARLRGLQGLIRGGMMANTLITLGFAILDDMGRTPEQRLEEIKKNWAAFDAWEKWVDDITGNAFQKTQDTVSGWFGGKAGEAPIDALMNAGKKAFQAGSAVPEKMPAYVGGGAAPEATGGGIAGSAVGKWMRSLMQSDPAATVLPALKNRLGDGSVPDITQTIKAEVIDNRPPQVTMNVSAPITVNGVTDPKAVAGAVQSALTSQLNKAKSTALHGGTE